MNNKIVTVANYADYDYIIVNEVRFRVMGCPGSYTVDLWTGTGVFGWSEVFVTDHDEAEQAAEAAFLLLYGPIAYPKEV
jgi:hypothetical protein